VVTAAEGEGLAVISRRARRVAVPLRRVAPLRVLGMDRGGLRLAADGEELRIGLLGRHQAANAAVALAVLAALDEAGIARVSPDRQRTGLAQARWPGRLELLAVAADGTAQPAAVDGPNPTAPDLLLDGAHNPHGTTALAAAVDELAPLLSPGRPTLLMGVLADKDVPGMLEPLAASRVLGTSRVITTSVPNSPRSLAATALADAWKESRVSRARSEAATPVADPARALEAALAESARVGGPLVVCGSLYLVGFLRGRLIDDETADTRPSDRER
jgi:dihydrofolate synthase/folylpolyglutamate synthase